MKLPPAVVVHGLAHARSAMAPGRPVTLLSGPGAATYAGAGWWRALVAASGHAGPDVLDCGAAPGRAMAALRAGCTVLVLDPGVPAWPIIEDRALAAGALLLRQRPPALDLATPGAWRDLVRWLVRDDTHPRVG